MEELPVTGLEELEKHVDVLLEAPDTPVDAKLFDEVELQLNGMFIYAFFLLSRPLCFDFRCYSGQNRRFEVERDVLRDVQGAFECPASFHCLHML